MYIGMRTVFHLHNNSCCKYSGDMYIMFDTTEILWLLTSYTSYTSHYYMSMY